MVQSVRWVVGLALVLALAGMGTVLMQGTGVSQEKAAAEDKNEEMEQIMEALDEILEDLEQLEDIQEQLDSIETTLGAMEKRLVKMEKIGLKTWDFVYKIRVPGGQSPPETSEMQEEIGKGSNTVR